MTRCISPVQRLGSVAARSSRRRPFGVYVNGHLVRYPAEKIFLEEEEREVKRVLVVIAVAAALLSVAVPSSLGQGNTTSPGYNFRINVTITDKSVVLSRSLAKRGWLAHFYITNKGKKAHVFDIGGLKRRVAPGKSAKLGSYLDTRGQYPYKVDGKTRGYFTVN
jgi:hypothetical protein